MMSPLAPAPAIFDFKVTRTRTSPVIEMKYKYKHMLELGLSNKDSKVYRIYQSIRTDRPKETAWTQWSHVEFDIIYLLLKVTI